MGVSGQSLTAPQLLHHVGRGIRRGGVSIEYLQKGRWKLSRGPRRGQEGRAGPAAPGVHQRVEEAEGQGGRGAQEAEGQAGQEEGDQGRAGEETCPTEEGRRGKIEERGE